MADLMNYRQYYVSADGPGVNATWSVYVEVYAHLFDTEPIDGSQQLVSIHSTEEAAYIEANRLQTRESRPEEVE